MNTRYFGRLTTLVGAMLVSLAPFAHAAPFAYITQSDSTVAVVDLATNAVVGTVPVQSNPFGVAVHPTGSHVYVANADSDSVSIIKVADGTSMVVPVGASPAGLAVHPDGTRLYVANEISDTVSVIDTATGMVIGQPLNVGDGPRGVAVNPTGTRVFVANNVSGDLSVIDTATLEVVNVPVGQRLVGVAAHPSAARVYVTDVMSNTVVVVNLAQNVAQSTISTIPLSDMVRPLGIAVHPSGSQVYVANVTGSIAVITTATSAVTYVTPAAGPVPGLFGIAVTSSGGQVYAVNQGANALFVMDTATRVMTRVPVDLVEPNSFGAFISPSATTCDTAALAQALAAAQAQATALQAANQALSADNGRLQGDLTTVRATLDSFLDKLFGDGFDGKIAAAARVVALADLTAARAAAPNSWRVRLAQQSFDQGEKAMRKRDWRHAVREYREVHAIVEWILGDRRNVPTVPPTGTGPVPVASGTPGSFPGCDTSALDQALATVASLQATNQSLTAENLRLRTELATARATVTSFVMRLFGEGSDGNVAAVARDAAREKLTKAQTAAPHDRRLKVAQHSFDNGLLLLKKQDWGRAVHEFRETHEVSERILKDKHAHWHRW